MIKTLKNPSFTILKIVLLISLLSLLGCNAQPTAVPTVDPKIFANTVSAARTEAVQTVYAMLTQSVTLTQTPTNTPMPTETMTITPVPPTLVPTRTIAATQAPTAVPTQGAYQCSITTLSPQSGASLSNGADFDLSVTFKNIGTEKWSRDTIDFKYLSGAKFQKSADLIDLPADVAPGDSIKLIVDMTAKTGTGVQNTTWGLVHESATFCSVGVNVNVK
jgi:hypothetical protein